MKKEFFFVLMLFLTTVGIQAQDTINRLSPKYYVNHPHWSDDTLKLDTAYLTSRYYFSANAHGETAKQCYAKDSLKIYGVAAAIYVEGVTFPNHGGTPLVIDTSYDSVCEYFRLYKKNPTGNLDVIAQTQVCALDSIVGYLMFLPQENLMGIYESYFEDGPITVVDTFYVGFTQYLDTQTVVDGRNMWLHWRMCLGTVGRYCTDVPDFPLELHDVVYSHDNYSGWQRYFKKVYLFPIYNPEEIYPPTPEGIAERGVLERYVTVSPNPARTEVKVVSSFPIKTMEAFNATGQKVCSLPASGPQAVLDVREWPSGTYVLNINTMAGMVTKKIVVME